MSLELLSNELLIEFFEYLSTGEIFHAFHGLNYRFNSVLANHFRMHGFDLRCISRSDFDAIGRIYFSSTPQQITSICFSNNEQTPAQINRFFNQGFEFSKFTYLKSLSIYYLSPGPLAHRIIGELGNLPNFSRLVYKPVYRSTNSFCAHRFINSIWHLPNLKYCCLQFKFGPLMVFAIPLTVSSSIEYLTIEDIDISPNEFIQLCNQTPNLQYLSLRLAFELPFYGALSFAPKITKLYITYTVRSDQLFSILKMLPMITYLKLNVQSFAIDGYQAEILLRTSLPQVKHLHFRMVHTLDDDDNKEQEIEKILDTFRRPFWIDEHRLFLQCEWKTDDRSCVFYTLPYVFEGYDYAKATLFKSTYPVENKRWLNKTVYALNYHLLELDCSAPLNIQFDNVIVLSIKLPVDGKLWSTVASLPRVEQLYVSLANDDDDGNNRNQLQSILGHMPHLLIFYIREDPSRV
ncbi:unnamed protein product, partial [Adineta ricciae]